MRRIKELEDRLAEREEDTNRLKEELEVRTEKIHTLEKYLSDSQEIARKS